VLYTAIIHKTRLLLEFISPYEPKTFYKADETGLFFRALPKKSLAVKEEKCIRGKMFKEILIELFVGNIYIVIVWGIWWEKWKSL
jgi:hypothetical protein